MRPLTVAVLILTLAPPAATAGERVDVNAAGVKLAVNARGTALVTYRARGRTVHLLAWGAVNALPPSQSVVQVHFHFDWSGGGESQHPPLGETVQNPCAEEERPPPPSLAVRLPAP